MGEFAHYLEVRQAVAGMKGAHLFDELDHLGAYVQKNRFDQDIEEQRAENDLTSGMGRHEPVVDRHFENEDWATRPVPRQQMADEVLSLLGTLDRTRKPGWLSAESHIRNYGDEGRNNLAHLLAQLRGTLSSIPAGISLSQPMCRYLCGCSAQARCRTPQQ